MGLSPAERFSRLPVHEQREWVKTLTPDVLEEIARREWWWEARPEQIPPVGDWNICLTLAGRGFGKSRMAAEWIVQRAVDHPLDSQGFPTEWLIIAQTLSDARNISIEGSSGVLRIVERRRIPHRYIRHPKPCIIFTETGTKIFFLGADSPDVGRGYNAAGAVLDEICIAHDEPIVTRLGVVPVQDVRVGDEVATRAGWRRVRSSGLTRRDVPILRIETDDGSVRVTPEHRVFTERGWIRACDVVPGDIMATCLPKMNTPNQCPVRPQPFMSGMAKSGTTTKKLATTTTETEACFTVASGLRSTAPFRMATKSTTSTETDGTTAWATSNACLSVNIEASRPGHGPIPAGLKAGASELPLAFANIGANAKTTSVNSFACTADKASSRLACELNTAAPIAETSSTPQHRPTVVRSVEPESRLADVYDLTVSDDAPEFFAGSGALLVHNCKWKRAKEAWYEGILPSLRADIPGDHPRTLVATTPKPIELIREWVNETNGTVKVVRGSTFDNQANLSAFTLEGLRRKYAGTAIGRQELYGELLDDRDGCLWTFESIEGQRITRADLDENVELAHIAVGVDPTLTDEGDEMGVVVVGRDYRNHMYVLADESLKGAGRPAAQHIWQVFYKWGADTVVIESNNAKRWMKEVLTDAYVEARDADLMFPAKTSPPLKMVDSRVGKKLRAEPVAMRYEQGTVHHVGGFKELEKEMLNFDPSDSHNSPNRMDALVHACRYLIAGERKKIRVSSVDKLWIPIG